MSSLESIEQKLNRAARLSSLFRLTKLSKFVLTQPCLMKQVTKLDGLLSIPSPLRDAFKGLHQRLPLEKHQMCDLTPDDDGKSINAAHCYVYACSPGVNLDRVWYSFVLPLTKHPLTRYSFAYFWSALFI